MCKYLRILSHLAGLVGAAIAVNLLCHEHPTNEVRFDYIGVIIGILALLVTLLVAWNIYSVVGVVQRVDNALQEQGKRFKEQEVHYEELRQEIISKTESIQTSTFENTAKALKRMESAEQAYVMLFNVTQAQVSALHKDNDYFQQYAHYQTALGALLKCPQFPSNIAYNINALLDMMDDILKIRENSDSINDHLYDEYRKEFIPNMEEIAKSSCQEFSFEDRQRFMAIAAKAMQIFKRTTI